MSMGILFVCDIYTPLMYPSVQRAQKRVSDPPELEFQRGVCEPLCGCWGFKAL